MTLQELMREIQTLSVEERKALINIIAESLADSDVSDQKYSLSDLAGLGAEIWQDVDAQTYVDQLRGEWEER
jgi:hypothetical protein